MSRWKERAAELRASGWSDAEVRDYKKGWDNVPSGHEVSLEPTYTSYSQAYTLPEQFKPLPKGDKGTWYRSTVAGQLAAVLLPPDPEEDARELAAAKAFVEDYEWRYNRRPTMEEARAAVSRRTDGAVISGDYEDLKRVFRQAGVPFGRIELSEPLPADPEAVIHQPVSRA